MHYPSRYTQQNECYNRCQRDDSFLFIFIHNRAEQHARQGNQQHIGSTQNGKDQYGFGFQIYPKRKCTPQKIGAGVGSCNIYQDWEKSFHQRNYPMRMLKERLYEHFCLNTI